ncbi:14002_t:CDS:1, partial [Gigaspora rosea]
LVAIVSAVLLANKNQKNSSRRIPEKNDSPTDNSNLLQTKAQKINFFKLALSADSIREEDLLTELCKVDIFIRRICPTTSQ